MKKAIGAAVAAALSLLLLFIPLVCAGDISIANFRVARYSTRADLDGDGHKETIAIKGRLLAKRGDSLQIAWDGEDKAKILWWRLRDEVNPWKVLVADVDGDGRQEVVVGAWRKTPKDRVLRNRLFVYAWTGKELFPIWLGSRLSHPFTDYTLADLDGDHRWELVALETGQDGSLLLGLYRWEEFGFAGEGDSFPPRNMESWVQIIKRHELYNSVRQFKTAVL